MPSIEITEVPTAPDGGINYEVPPSILVVKHNGQVYAGPGDHIHGHAYPDGIEVGVYDADGCIACAEIAAQAVDDALGDMSLPFTRRV